MPPALPRSGRFLDVPDTNPLVMELNKITQARIALGWLRMVCGRLCVWCGGAVTAEWDSLSRSPGV